LRVAKVSAANVAVLIGTQSNGITRAVAQTIRIILTYALIATSSAPMMVTSTTCQKNLAFVASLVIGVGGARNWGWIERRNPKTCGQFVDRILSTARILADSEWEGTAKP
jgi:hypothetical protein